MRPPHFDKESFSSAPLLVEYSSGTGSHVSALILFIHIFQGDIKNIYQYAKHYLTPAFPLVKIYCIFDSSSKLIFK
jgi:hypothetical protein